MQLVMVQWIKVCDNISKEISNENVAKIVNMNQVWWCKMEGTELQVKKTLWILNLFL